MCLTLLDEGASGAGVGSDAVDCVVAMGSVATGFTSVIVVGAGSFWVAAMAVEGGSFNF